MDSNRCSCRCSAQPHDDLAALTAALDRLATRDRSGLPPAVRAQRVLALRRLVDHLRDSLDPESADTRAQRQHERRGCGRPPPSRAWSPARGCWTQKPARSCWPRWSRWPARPAPTTPQRDQRRADALTELARRTLEAGQLPQSGGVRPQLLVTVDLDSLVGRPGAVGVRWAGWARWPPRRVGDWPATGR